MDAVLISNRLGESCSCSPWNNFLSFVFWCMRSGSLSVDLFLSGFVCIKTKKKRRPSSQVLRWCRFAAAAALNNSHHQAVIKNFDICFILPLFPIFVVAAFNRNSIMIMR